MKKLGYLILAGLMLAVTPLAAAERGTKDEAKALVEKASAFVQKDGASAYPVISDTKGPYVDRDLYVIIFDKTGTILAHGANKGLIGVNLWNNKDPDGVQFVQEFWKTANASPNGEGWVNFKFTHPQTKEIEKKVMFVRKLGEVIVIAGFYPEES